MTNYTHPSPCNWCPQDHGCSARVDDKPGCKTFQRWFCRKWSAVTAPLKNRKPAQTATRYWRYYHPDEMRGGHK